MILTDFVSVPDRQLPSGLLLGSCSCCGYEQPKYVPSQHLPFHKKPQLLQWVGGTGAMFRALGCEWGLDRRAPLPAGSGLKYFCGSRIFPDCFTGTDVLCCCECGGVAVPDGCCRAGQLETPSKERKRVKEWLQHFRHTVHKLMFTSLLDVRGLY